MTSGWHALVSLSMSQSHSLILLISLISLIWRNPIISTHASVSQYYFLLGFCNEEPVRNCATCSWGEQLYSLSSDAAETIFFSTNSKSKHSSQKQSQTPKKTKKQKKLTDMQWKTGATLTLHERFELVVNGHDKKEKRKKNWQQRQESWQLESIAAN